MRQVVLGASLLIATNALAQPANDDPCGAVALTVNASCVNTAGTTVASTNTAGIPAPGCANYSGRDVWYTVTVPANGNVTVTTTAGSITDGGMAAYTASTCAAAFTLVTCNDDQGGGNFMPRLNFSCQTPGTVYYIRFWRYGGGTGTFSICATTASGPTNETPCTATALAVGTTCATTTGSTGYACTFNTVSAPGCGAFSTTVGDVWYSFVAPASGAIVLQTTAGTLTDGAMALYSATACNGTFDVIECDNDDGPGAMPILSNFSLTPGATYYVRFWGYGGAFGTFNICAWAPALAAGTCTYALEMHDAGSDGWGTSSVGISINGGAFTNYTVTANYELVNIGLNIGDILVVQYTNTGANQSQNQYWIRQLTGGAGIFASGRSPANGIVHTETVDCTPPANLAEDCTGGRTICSGQAFNNNPAHTGFNPDLAGDNQGCLSAGERQGTWYHFSPSASGTIGFTIAPSNPTDDYDFAIWGPLGSVSCPPGSTPLRCSFSALSGNTGCGNGATDTSEDPSGDRWVSTFNVIAGEVYTLYVSNFSQSGLQFDLSWQLTGGASLDCTVLPVELIDLSATPLGDRVLVEWATATELNNAYFIVERSANAVDYDPLGLVPGSGTSMERTDYSWADDQPAPGVNYYRLTQVDLDGTTGTSQAVSAVLLADGADPVVYPNPVSDGRLTLALPPGYAAASGLQVLDAQGRAALVQPIVTGSDARSTVAIDLTAMDAGVYSVLVHNAQGATLGRSRFIKR